MFPNPFSGIIFEDICTVLFLFFYIQICNDIILHNHSILILLTLFLLSSILSRSYERGFWYVRCWYCILRYSRCSYWHLYVSLPFVQKEKDRISSAYIRIRQVAEDCFWQKAMHILFSFLYNIQHKYIFLEILFSN